MGKGKIKKPYTPPPTGSGTLNTAFKDAFDKTHGEEFNPPQEGHGATDWVK